MAKTKAIVLFSGGLDSRLAVKIMQEQNLEILLAYFKLSFSKNIEKEIKEFAKKEKIKLKIFDCTKKKLLQEYLDVIKNPKYGRGAGVNPCIDCRIFMLKKVKEFAGKNNLIVTGEVLGERPMSQMKKSMNLIEEVSGLKNRLLRPLSAKILPETEAEKKGLVDRKKFYDIYGRRREKQIALAKKFKISYPHPAGGCLLCEKELKKRFEFLLKRGLNENEIKFVNIARHFVIDKCWIVLGRNEKENKIIEMTGRDYELIVPDFSGPGAVIMDKCGKKVKEKVNKLIKAYSKKGSLKERKKFDKWKL